MSQKIENHCYIDSHTHHLKSTNPIVKETLCYPSDEPSLSFGIHPWYIDQFDQSAIEDLNEKLSQFAIIGECGLDRCIQTDFSLQLSIFERHLIHADKFQKSLVVHCVKAESDLLKLRKKYKNNWFLHGFLSNSTSIQQFLNINKDTWFGFGHRLFESTKLQKTLVECPLEHILLETDSQNKYKIEDIYKKVSILKNISLEHLKQSIQLNHFKCFQSK